MTLPEWGELSAHIMHLEEEGLVERTFLRLDRERQEAVLKAILDEATEHGPASLNIKRVASRAKVAVGSLYQYFGNRTGLLDFSVALCVRFLSESFDASKGFLEEMPLREALKIYLSYGVEWGKEQAGLTQFVVRAAYHGDSEFSETVVRPVGTAMRAMVSGMLEAAQQRGEIRDDVDLAGAARAINAMAIAIGDSQLLPYLNTYMQVVDETMSFRRVLDAMVELVVRGLEPSKEEEP